MITVPKEAGGAGITPKHGEWKCVDAIFPLHDEAMNKQCIKDWSQKTFLSADDLDQIRNTFGENVRIKPSLQALLDLPLMGASTYRLAFTSHFYSLTFGSSSSPPYSVSPAGCCSVPFPSYMRS